MGLDIDYDTWHGAYSAFHRWRCKIADVAGLPPLDLMEGFGGEFSRQKVIVEKWPDLKASLPIQWECLRPDPLLVLLKHSDCDGRLTPHQCFTIANRLQELIPLLPDEDNGGHIGNWRVKTQQFIDGLRAASADGKGVRFH